MQRLGLHGIHAMRGATFFESAGQELVRTFGDVAAEYAAARSSAVLVDLSARPWLRITGDDRVSFLQGMVTNDIKGLAEGRALYAAMLTAKGAMVSDGRVWRRPRDLLVDLEPGQLDAVKRFLEQFLISEDAEIQDATPHFALIGIYGPRNEELIRATLGWTGQLPKQDAVQEFNWDGRELALIGNELLIPRGIELRVPRSSLGDVWQRLLTVADRIGARPAGSDAMDTVRVEAGIPRYGVDMDERTIPLEANLERAINYEKGCYIGQEVIARATFRGQVSRKLTGLLLGESKPAPRAELKQGERKVGWITSVVYSPAMNQNIAMAYVHRDFLEPGTALEVAGQTEPALLHALPFVSTAG